MQNFFQQLLKSEAIDSTQVQKEALVDLCLLGMYSDALLSLSEKDLLEEISSQLNWSSPISFSGYLQRNIPKVRDAKNDLEKRTNLINDISQRLESIEFKQQ